MKVEMLQDLNSDDIKQIWMSYHEQRKRLSFTLNVIKLIYYLHHIVQ